MSREVKASTAWLFIAILSVVSAGAYVGNEAAIYFWDLTAYVRALDTLYPYRFDEPYPFLYPPAALQLFQLARTHLFELMSIAYVGAIALFLSAVARLPVPRRFEWLFASTAMGGLGVVSLLAGNVGVVLNLTVLALALYAAMGNSLALRLLPIMIAAGALIKPQFALYLGLLFCLERSRAAALVKAIAAGAAALAVHAAFILLRPNDWNEYTQAAMKRTMELRDFGWGPAALTHHVSDANGAVFATYAATLLAVGALAFVTWRKSSRPIPGPALVSLAFIVLTFANPRIPLYDLYAAAIALGICCAYAERASGITSVLFAVMSINLIPWLIANFTRTPSAYPWWLQDLLIMHMLGIGSLLVALSRAGIARER